MKLLVTSERRFKRSPDGNIWTTSIDDAEFWARYLEVFEAVTILARVEDCNSPQSRWKSVITPRIAVHALPPFVGVSQYIRTYVRIQKMCKEAMAVPTAVILRTPGTIARTLVPILMDRRHPFGAEVIGDSYQAFAPGVVSHPLRPLLRWWFTYALKQQCKRACAISYVTQQTLQQRYPPSSNAFVTSYSSISLRDMDFTSRPKPPPSKDTTITVASVGSMERSYKGFEELIEAASICCKQGWKIRLLLIGGGRSLPSLEAFANQLHVSTEFTGELPGPSAVRAELNRADCFVLPTKNEGLPRAIIEAMAMALPCVATTVGGIPELLPSEFLVPPGNSYALAESLKHLLQKSPDEWSAIALRNLGKAMEYRENNLSEKRRVLYLKVKSTTHQYYGLPD